MSRRLTAHPRCPSEAALEAWAIRNAREGRLARGRRHLERCSTCRQRHNRFLRFYRGLGSGGLRVPVRTGPSRPISADPCLPRPVIHTLRPFHGGHSGRPGRRAVTWAPGILASAPGRIPTDGDFLSVDGSIQARRLEPGPSSLVWLRLAADPPVLGRRALVLLPGEGIPYQSDELGFVRALPAPPPATIDRIEIVSGLGRADYGGASANGRETVPSQVILDAGSAGTILVEQEEGDGGEPVLGICLSAVPPSLGAHRLFAGFAPAGGPAIVEQAIGGEAYFYGPDLFDPFTVWIYVR